MDDILGRPLAEVLSQCPQYADMQVLITAAHGKYAGERQDGTLRVIAVRPDALVAARFLDGEPKSAEEKESHV